MPVKNDSAVKVWEIGQFLALPIIRESDIGQINLLSIKLCFLICEMKMLTYLLHKEVVRIKQDNPSKSTSDCHTTNDKHMLTA